MSFWTWILLGLLGIFLLSGIRIVRPTHKMLIETLGKYTRTKEQGFTWIIPIIQNSTYVNITETMADISNQKIITKDDLNADVDAVVYYRVLDPKKAVYEVDDFAKQVISLAQTTLRNIIGKLTLTEANTKRGEINIKLEQELQRQIKEWGMKIVRVEMQRIDPPRDVQDAMNAVVVAERKRVASTELANAREIEADGFRRSAIKEAEGRKQASVLEAEGKAKAFKLINESFKGNAQLEKKLDVTRDSLKDNTKVVLTEKGITPNIILGEIPIKR